MDEILRNALGYAAKYRAIGRAHYIAAVSASRMNKLFGIPVIVITAVVGTTIFGTLEQNPNHWLRIAAGLFSLAGTILASLQTTLGFAQTAEKHKSAGEAYRSIQRKFEMFELKFRPSIPATRDQAVGELEQLVNILDELPKSFPTLPDCFYQRALKEERRNDN
jgi:hypothetical protein